MRLFVGLPVPPSDAYADVTARLRQDHPDLRPVPDGSWHVTARFLGEVSDPTPVADALEEAVDGRRALPCRVAGLGAFSSPAKATVVWAGVEAPGVGRLVERIHGATALYGKAPDPRPFRAHATLGRFKVGADLSRDCHDMASLPFAEGALDRVVLWESILGPAGPTYREVATYGLR